MPRIDLRVDEIPQATPLRLEQAGTAVVVIRAGDRIAAFVDRCPHADWPLSEGELIDGVLQCQGHGLEFDIVSGRCLNSPEHGLKPLSVVRSDDRVWIEWSDSEP
jgi:nitrite reductase/ring-hydroxylating ferredoxin subunit